jgi:hypothetical protein
MQVLKVLLRGLCKELVPFLGPVEKVAARCFLTRFWLANEGSPTNRGNAGF